MSCKLQAHAPLTIPAPTPLSEKSAHARGVPVTWVKSSLMLNVTTFDCPGRTRIKKPFARQRTWTLTTSHVEKPHIAREQNTGG